MRDRGTNLVLESVRTSQRVPLRTGILIFVSTALTHLCGGSSGREGACLQIGASVGQTIGKLFHFDEQNLHLITMCGMSGLFTALLGTPITAAVFSMEVISVGVPLPQRFHPLPGDRHDCVRPSEYVRFPGRGPQSSPGYRK